jgi:peptidoglycan/xylan/chitin deacetylase (PgdA/CDA1 family)
MALLALLRYRVVPLEELARALREGGMLPRRAVAITVDDGYRDNLEIAHPILRRHRFPATIFLVSAKLGGESDWSKRGAAGRRPLLSSDQVLAMRDEGVRFGAHTRTHPRLPDTPDEAVGEEIAGSREELGQLLDEDVETFAYPFGGIDERAVAAVESAGFLAAVSVEPLLANLGSDPLRIPRIEIRGSDSALHFLRKLWLGGA